MSDKIIMDFNIFGSEDGLIVILQNEQAVKNGITCWLGSKLGERIRNISKGGLIVSQITKNMSTTRLNDLKKLIKLSAEADFNNLFYFKNISLDFDSSTKILTINYAIFIPLLNKNINGDSSIYIN